ncbi:hypothetical protein E7T09_00470 [Deinococcus sp. KSM4-11]|uniref:hypothetical protein n=1 Tax=Deinococcus sp. KSM4-11 TaxID=2568654 RepID=UPI0010A40370|nr:hypothetical protein [Deinococcus sp. KSM4-11]THF87754.1 hypothetical protein E7T09_00470 [Deinococcus sp. KSM4-11]
MTDPNNDSGEVPVPFRTLFVDDRTGYIYGVTEGDSQYPLYVFTPLREACVGHYEIPVGPNWPEYAVDFVLTYVPVTAAIPAPYPSGITLGINRRPKDTQRPWDQATYHGWPLYYVADHQTKAEKGNHPAMFEPVTLDIEVIEPSDGVITLPGPNIGP